MQSSTPIIDIHSHSTLKPYGISFYENTQTMVYGDSACIWTPDRYSKIDKAFENIIGVSRYRQADYETLVQGQIKIVSTSLYPQEIGFFDTKQNLPTGIEIIIAQFASLLGKKRIEYIKGNGLEKYNYFEDLQKEYMFLMQLSGSNALGSSKKYHIIGSANQLNTISNLLVIPNIEGAHVFCNGTDVRNIKNWDGVENRIALVKNWEAPPLYVTMAHHFFNGLCTHAKSLFSKAGDLLNQSYGMRDYDYAPNDNEPPISEIGYKVIKLLLSKDNGRRILIDVKHMSLEARKLYYDFLQKNFPNNDVPVLSSHGAVTEYYHHQINMEPLDILQIYKTKGLFGIEIDQRVLGYDEVNGFWQKVKNIFRKRKTKEYLQVEFVWKNIKYIAEQAYQNGYTDNPWACICIGSDFDGIINPLNNFRDAQALPNLYSLLIEFLKEYWNDKNSIIPKNTPNGNNAEDIIYQIMYKNALEFIKKNYK